MRSRPAPSRLAPGLLSVASGGALSFAPLQQGPSFDSQLSRLVERLVRAGLKRVASGEASPHQALQGVVSRLASELPDLEYASLLRYFEHKKTEGTLTPAKHLLLKALRAAKSADPHAQQARGQQQQQQSAQAPAPARPEQGAQQQQQPQPPLQQQLPHVGRAPLDARKQQQVSAPMDTAPAAPAAAAAQAEPAADEQQHQTASDDSGPQPPAPGTDASAPGSGGGGGAGLAAGVPPLHNLAPARHWFSEPCMLGIDEAGRGPVLGAMVYACVAAPLSYRDTLKTKSYADSKALTEAERSRLFAVLAADPACTYSVDVLSAAAISGAMLGRSRVSLNALAEAATQRLIRGVLDAGVALREVYIDTVGDPQRYAARLSSAFPGLAFTVCPKADALYPIVSAASIAAKVTRDAGLAAEQAALPEGRAGPLGTGYPHDAATQAWLAANCDAVFGFPPLVRFSWETAGRIMEQRCVAVTWPDGPEGAGGSGSGGQQQTLAAFRRGDAAAGAESSGLGRHPYFRLRRLQRVGAF